jgi:hypothetical protein
MPSTGTPSANTEPAASARLRRVTEAGPPERITAFGAKSRRKASVTF